MAAKNWPQSIYADPVHDSSIQNNRFVVARKKQTQRIDHSQPRPKKQGVKLQTPPHHKNRKSASTGPEKKTKCKYRPGTLALREIRCFQKSTELLI